MNEKPQDFEDEFDRRSRRQARDLAGQRRRPPGDRDP